MKPRVPGFSTDSDRNFWFVILILFNWCIGMWIVSMMVTEPEVQYVPVVSTTAVKACNSENICNTYTVEQTTTYQYPQ